MTTDFIKEIENKELIQKLIDHGFGKIVEAFIQSGNKMMTRNSRVNKSGCCRTLDLKVKQLDSCFELMRDLLREDLGIPEKVINEVKKK